MSTKINKPNVDWQSEMTRIANKHHVIVCWVAIILDPIWFVSDYFTIPSHWVEFLILRLAVAFLSFLGVAFRSKLKLSSDIIVFIPLLGISLQNAYMWSVMDIPTLQKHAFAYIALWIGGGMLILWKAWWTIAVVVISLIANIITFSLFSTLNAGEILINGGLLVGTVALITIVLIQTRYNLTRKEIISRLALAQSNEQLALQNVIIEEKNKDITDSINYAKRIQTSILPDRSVIKEQLGEDFFIYYKPKDIVSGDFYWYNAFNEHYLLAVADCTGHGVPGALMSMIGSNLLTQIATHSVNHRPAYLLTDLHDSLKLALHTNAIGNNTADGMDIALIKYDWVKKQLDYAGANRPLLHIRDGVLNSYAPDKKSIGGDTGVERYKFTLHSIEILPGDCVYLFSDGLADQFGGKLNKKMTTKTLRSLLLDNYAKPMSEQEKGLADFFEKWKGSNEQVDDVLVVGIRF